MPIFSIHVISQSLIVPGMFDFSSLPPHLYLNKLLKNIVFIFWSWLYPFLCQSLLLKKCLYSYCLLALFHSFLECNPWFLEEDSESCIHKIPQCRASLSLLHNHMLSNLRSKSHLAFVCCCWTSLLPYVCSVRQSLYICSVRQRHCATVCYTLGVQWAAVTKRAVKMEHGNWYLAVVWTHAIKFITVNFTQYSETVTWV